MKTFNLTSRSMLAFLLGLPLLLITNCSDPNDGSSGINPFSKPNDWVSMVNELFIDPGIIVEKHGSIQDAINEAEPGEAIYIAPGTYQEAITINKPDIKLVGLSGDGGEKVAIKNNITIAENSNAAIINIQYKNSSTNSSRSSTSGGKRSTGAFKVTRQELSDKIAHYTFEVRVGNGPFDVVRIHRVVREYRAYQPARTKGGVFMLHGASLSFEAIFLKAGSDIINTQTSSAFYLASGNIDVWGMDFGWTLIPAETTDFSFMKDWGVERDAKHALAAMSVARLIRGLTGQGFGRMNLLGFSYGVIVGYAGAGNETQQHPCLRDIKGIVAVDQVLKYANEDNASRMSMCAAATGIKTQINNGTYQGANGKFLSAVGNLAITQPDEPFTLTSLPANLSNSQAALFFGIFPSNPPPAPSWHFIGGVLDGFVPKEVLYSDPARWYRLMASLPPYQPNLTTYEARACGCNEENVTFDDHLDKIKVPILYVGAGGAFGSLGEHTSKLTNSSDATNHIVSLKPDDQRAIDFGHGDLFIGNDAPTLVWEKLRQWLTDHNNHGFQ